MELLYLIKTYGPDVGLFLCIVAFTLVRDVKREKSLNARIDKLESEQKEVILPLVEKTTQTIATNTVVMERNIQVMDRNHQIMEELSANIKAMQR